MKHSLIGPTLGAALLIFVAAPASAQLERAQFGPWEVESTFENRRFSHCVMSATYRTRAIVFTLEPNAFHFGLYDQRWHFQPKQFHALHLQIDGGGLLPLRMRAAQKDLLIFSVPNTTLTPPFFSLFHGAKSLRVTFGTPDLDSEFAIASAQPAFARMAECVRAGLLREAEGNTVEPSAPRPPARAPAPARPPSRPTQTAENAIGTGFYVSFFGHIVTAEHVVRGCRFMRAQALGGVPVAASLVAKSERDDLALLKTGSKAAAIAPFRAVGVRLGDAVVLFGFPLQGALASSGNLTAGNVSALAGLRDDQRMLQISAPAQPGNSGGPLLDLRGRVAGVLLQSLDPVRIARETGTLPQNVNFAVKTSVVANFLEANEIQVPSGGAQADLSVADVAERARAFTVRIWCLQ